MLYRHVSDLLDVAKLEAGRMEMRYAQSDLAAVVRFIASTFEMAAAEKQIDFSVQVPETLPAQVDVEKCRRIILNILSNAFKFTPGGGAIALTLRGEDKRAVLQVTDNGPGVPEPMREAVFERFRQVEGSSNRRFGGTGLGLAIVRELVDLHGGSVNVAEAPGGGALFTVGLPLNAPDGVEILSAPAEPDNILDRQALDELCLRPGSASQPERKTVGDATLILVVEDNPDMNAYLVELLQRHYRVAAAFDGHEGLSKARVLRPDLILSDVMMPSMSGDRMVEELRRIPEMSDVPIVMLTAKADDALQVNMLRAGAQDYISKPFSDEELLARIAGLVAKRRQTMEEILLLNADLERRVLERTGELTAANMELDAFAYAVSHDLRAPLRAMIGFSKALTEDYGGQLTGEAREYLDQIDIASRHMGQLIDGLLALSRSTRGELRRESVDISALAGRILEELAREDPDRKVPWQIEPGITVHGDSGMMESLMTNLLGNAWKYTAGTAEPLIRVYSEQDVNARRICVADNGAGFDMKYAERLFKPFQRLHRQNEFPGIGIGLATVQRIVHRHGGAISADGTPGQGATFRFTMPPGDSG
jgi:signal transduction histidine kinase